MSHLSDAELVDLLDGTLARDRATHISVCSACRAQHDAMRATIAEVRAVDTPEPSPLFWDHLPSQVAREIAAPERAAVGWWVIAVPLLAVLIIAVSLLFTRVGRRDAPPASSVAEQAAEPSSAPDADAEEAWQFVVALADDLQWEDAHAAGIGVTPGAADDVALQLTPEEQSELSRLLTEELKETGA